MDKSGIQRRAEEACAQEMHVRHHIRTRKEGTTLEACACSQERHTETHTDSHQRGEATDRKEAQQLSTNAKADRLLQRQVHALPVREASDAHGRPEAVVDLEGDF